MVLKSLVLFMSVTMSQSTKIPCDFKFEEENRIKPISSHDRLSVIRFEAIETLSQNLDLFECEEHDDEFENDGQRDLNLTTPDEYEYEDIETTCQVSKRTIQPKALNNIYNKLTKVLNTSNFIQSINIEQCLNRKEPCNNEAEAPFGYKHICRQKHVKITLKALNHQELGETIVDEQFYYPSHCVCELVKVKRKKRIRVTRNKNTHFVYR